MQFYCKSCNKAYVDANKDRCRETVRKAYAAHREERVAYMRVYNEVYRDRVNASKRKHYEKNIDKRRAESRRWHAANPEAVQRLNARYRALKTSAEHVGEPIDRAAVWERDGGRCHICGGLVPRKTFTLDHLIPLSRGGSHTYENVRVAHGVCNSRRGPGRIAAQLLLFG